MLLKALLLTFIKRKRKKKAGQPAEPLWLHTQHVGIEREQLRFIAIT